MPESEFIEWGVGLSVSFGRKGGGISLTNDHITQRKVRMNNMFRNQLNLLARVKKFNNLNITNILSLKCTVNCDT